MFDLDKAKILLEHLKNLPDERFTYSQSMVDRESMFDDVSAKMLANDCDTCGCVAGWTIALFDIENKNIYWDKIRRKAGVILGISEEEAGFLFQGDECYGFKNYPIMNHLFERDKQEAIRRLEYLIHKHGAELIYHLTLLIS